MPSSEISKASDVVLVGHCCGSTVVSSELYGSTKEIGENGR